MVRFQGDPALFLSMMAGRRVVLTHSCHSNAEAEHPLQFLGSRIGARALTFSERDGSHGSIMMKQEQRPANLQEARQLGPRDRQFRIGTNRLPAFAK
jgi:hypothetical protein